MEDRPGVTSDMTLESFEVAPETRFAHAVASAVAEEPGTLYNPVILYGPAGAGKTHLLSGIALALPGRSEKLTSARALAAAIRDNSMKLDGVDVLLVDELDDEQTLDAIRETLTEFVASGRQVVVATRLDSPAYKDLWSWGETHDRALAADCWPLGAAHLVDASQIAALVREEVEGRRGVTDGQRFDHSHRD